MLNIFHIVPFGPGFNIGNFLIQQATRRNFRRHSDTPINFITIASKGIGQASGLTKSVIHSINNQGDGVILGGGNLFENGDLEVDPNALKALRKPLTVFSSSYGRLYDELGNLHCRTDTLPESKSRAVVEKAFSVVARDQATADYFSSLCDNERLVVGGCPTLFMPEYGISNTLHDELGFSVNCSSLIAVRNPEQMNVPQKVKNSVPGLTKDFIELLQSRATEKPWLLCNDQRDIEYAMSLTDNVVYTSDVYEYFSLLQTVDTCVSFRVHTSLPLWALLKPAINISYDERSQSLIDSIGCGDRNINMIASSDVLRDTEKALDNYEMTSPREWVGLAEIQRQSIVEFLAEVESTQ